MVLGYDGNIDKMWAMLKRDNSQGFLTLDASAELDVDKPRFLSLVSQKFRRCQCDWGSSRKLTLGCTTTDFRDHRLIRKRILSRHLEQNAKAQVRLHCRPLLLHGRLRHAVSLFSASFLFLILFSSVLLVDVGS